MTGWTAANSTLSPSRHDEGDFGDSTQTQLSTHSKGREKQTETPEAGLARLTEWYNAAMTAVGALQRISDTLTASHVESFSASEGKSKAFDDAEMNAMIQEILPRAAIAARDALERTLLDPLLVPYTTTLFPLLRKNDYDCQRCGPLALKPAIRTSLRRLVLPALLNYGDLLIRCCPNGTKDGHWDILDRGAVKKFDVLLRFFDDDKPWGWGREENTILTQKMALAAYVDASDADGSDPSLWFRLACAARGLGRVLKDNDKGLLIETEIKDFESQTERNGNQNQNKRRRMNASSSTLLPPLKDVLPMVAKSHKMIEMDCDEPTDSTMENAEVETKDSAGCTYKIGGDKGGVIVTSCMRLQINPESEDNHDPKGSILDLSHRLLERHALERGLSILPPGAVPNRILTRALEEHRIKYHDHRLLTHTGTTVVYDDDPYVLTLSRNCWSSLGCALLRACRGTFSSSCPVLLQISPILTLPPAVLVIVCEFLWKKKLGDYNKDLRQFEATCSSLSSNITTARACLENRQSQKIKEESDTNLQIPKVADVEIIRIISKDAKEKKELDGESIACVDKPMKKEEIEHPSSPLSSSVTKHPINNLSSHRTSKRVRSNRSKSLTFEKRTERSMRKNSIEHCLLSVVLHCSAGHPAYTAFFDSKPEWVNIKKIRNGVRRAVELALPNSGGIDNDNDLNSNLITYSALSSQSLFQAFIEKWSIANSGPTDLLFRFLAHVSCHVGEIFSNERCETTALSSCLRKCHLLLCETDNSLCLCPYWYGRTNFVLNAENVFEAIEIHAVNLLAAELCLSHCNDGDNICCLRFVIPILLRFSKMLSADVVPPTARCLVMQLRTRTHWITALMYIQLTKVGLCDADIQEANRLTLVHIDNAVTLLSNAPLRSRTIHAPHVASPDDEIGRKKLSVVTLKTFRDRLESFAVLSRGRNAVRRQCYVSSGIDEKLEGGNALKLVADEILIRYGLNKNGGGTKHFEILDDFLRIHKNRLMKFKLADECDPQDAFSPKYWGSLWSIIPSMSRMTGVNKEHECENPEKNETSLLTVVIACLPCTQTCDSRIMLLLVRLVIISLYQERCVVDKRRDAMPDLGIDHVGDDVSNCGFDRSSDNRGIHIQASKFFLSKVVDLIIGWDKVAVITMLSCPIVTAELVALIWVVLDFSRGYTGEIDINEKVLEQRTPDQELLVGILMLVAAVHQAVDTSINKSETVRDLACATFTMLVKIVIEERRLIPILMKTKGLKSERKVACIMRVKYLSIVMSEVSALLSTYGSTFVSNITIRESPLISEIVLQIQSKENSNIKLLDISPIGKLIESLIWFWTVATKSEEVISSMGPSNTNLLNELLVPSSSVIVALCGAVGYGSSNSITKSMQKSLEKKPNDSSMTKPVLGEYFDTDDSAIDWASEESNDDDKNNVLQMLCKTVQSIGLVFNSITDKEACSRYSYFLAKREIPLLPLLVTRVLNCIAEFVLTEFVEEKVDCKSSCGGIWAEQYPFGFTSSGAQLDLILHKAYRCLHGFTLVAPHHQSSIKSDAAVPSVSLPISQESFRYIKPESTKAAAQLYRCINRAYSGKRRSGVKTFKVTNLSLALECVLSALPPMEIDKKSIAIRKFIFRAVSGDAHPYSFDNRCELLDEIKIDCIPPDFPSTIFSAEITPSLDEKDEVFIIRKGICEQLAEGNIPRPGLVSSSLLMKGNESSDPSMIGEREESARTEEQLHQKFNAILDSLCYDTSNSEAWYRIGICLSIKADIISDRIISERMTNVTEFGAFGAYDPKDFFVESNFASTKSRYSDCLSLSELLESQFLLYKSQSKEHEKFLGDDLSMYIKTSWTNFLLLRTASFQMEDMFEKVGALNEKPCTKDKIKQNDKLIWNDIQAKFDEKKYAEWQNAWGGLFVSALQVMSKRCLTVAMFLAKENNGVVCGQDELYAEIAEALGTMYYNEVSGSIVHGFPMRTLSLPEKRRKAEHALSCFERAKKNISNSEDSNVTLWDMHFMIGKCQEKVAKSLVNEKFQSPISKGIENIRSYEQIMKSALQSYSDALSAAKQAKVEGNLSNVGISPFGGSSHGVIEFIYRIHASRLKVMLTAVRLSENIRENAEQEALRISEKYWFEEENKMSSENITICTRKRVWLVLEDVVAAMNYCRRMQPFFHRSVYRHAQALLWAPVFNDPGSELKEGSCLVVPASKTYKLEGLTPCMSHAKCAEAIIHSLFDKKRSQLCGVWVTTPSSPSPFEAINDNTRKYDSLRCKYILAYIECLRLCNSKQAIETLLSRCYLGNRDIPSFYEFSAKTKGGVPLYQHSKDNLVQGSGLTWSIIKHANESVARIIREEVKDLDTKGINKNINKTTLKSLLKGAFICFLRLNCPIDNIIWQTQKVKSRLVEGRIIEAETLLECHSYFSTESFGKEYNSQFWTTESKWEQKMLLLRRLISDLETLFPSAAAQYCLDKKRKKEFLLMEDLLDEEDSESLQND